MVQPRWGNENQTNMSSMVDFQRNLELTRMTQATQALNEIEEERLMLEKAQAMNDMSIYEDYIRRRNERKATEQNRLAKANKVIIMIGITVGIVGIILLLIMWALFAY